MMKNILLLLFHPRLESSKVNKHLHHQFLSNKNIRVKDMYELYPDFNINIKTEQHDLLHSDLIILQHPFFWYAAPPLTKQWIDLVLEYGWAYGKKGDKLKDKKIMHIISSGGNFDTYSSNGKNLYTYLELLRPFELTYKLCQMKQLPPYIIPGANKLDKNELELHSQKLNTFINLIANGKEVISLANDIEYLNHLT